MKNQTTLTPKQTGRLRRFKSRSLLISHPLRARLGSRRGFGLNEVIGIAAGIIIAVVVVIPGLQGFAGDILDNLTSWWNDMSASVFSTN